MLGRFALVLIAISQAHVYAAARCGGLLSPATIRLRELERLSGPRPVILGQSESPFVAFETLLPLEKLRVRTSFTAEGETAPGPSRIEEIWFSARVNHWFHMSDYLRFSRIESGRPTNVTLACKDSNFPLTLMVHETDGGFVAHITATEGSVLGLSLRRNVIAHLRLTINYDAAGSILRLAYLRTNPTDRNSVSMLIMEPAAEKDVHLLAM